MRRLRSTVAVVALATLGLVFSGVALAQGGGDADPQTMCEQAGGQWDESANTCLGIWCGWPDDPPICAWMAAQDPTGANGSSPDTQPGPNQTQAPQSAPAQPSYTG